MPSRLITPSQLSLFSISPVNGAWWEELQQCIPLDLTEVVRADQAVDASGMRRDAVGGQHPLHHPFHTFVVVLDLGAVLAKDPPGDVFSGAGLLLPSSSISIRASRCATCASPG
ncbi:MAG: hypothetical protein VXV94_03250 [Cyanobacteriota bacterium]|nr:hypothetical protein [Cyanobacteriota bacterium]